MSWELAGNIMGPEGPPGSIADAPVTSIFGRLGDVVADPDDYAEFYQPLGAIPVTSVFARAGDITAQAGDYAAFYASLSGSYSNPSWIASLAWTKITGAPSFEPALGNPSTNGFILSSTTAGVRSWVAPPTFVDAVPSVFSRTGAIVAQAGDYSSFYASLSGSYSDPSWIASLAWSKITGAPSFVTGPAGSPGQFQYNNAGVFAGQNTLRMNGIQLEIVAGGQTVFLDNSDPTKKLSLALANIPPGVTRSLLIPNSVNTVAVAGLNAAGGDFLSYIDALGIQQFGTFPAAAVSSFAAGDLSPLFTTSETNTAGAVALSFAAIPVNAGKYLGRVGSAGSDGAPSFVNIPAVDITGNWPAARGGVPAGGTASYVLTKSTGTDYDYVWAALPAAPVSSVFTRTGAITAAEADYQSFYPRLSQTYANPSWISSLAFSKITGVPSYEPALGNPSSNGMVLSSTTAGVRSWISAGGTGTVTQINTNSPITGGPITGTGTLDLNQNVDLGMTASQSIKVNDAASTTLNVLTLSHNVSITPTANLGTAILFQGESDTTVDRTMAQITASWGTITDASRTAYLDLRTVLNGTLGTALRLWGSNGASLNNTTDPGAGFFNVPTAGGYKINNVNIFGPGMGSMAVGDQLRALGTSTFDSFPTNTLQAQPTDKAGTTNTSAGTMLGLAQTLTMQYSGRVLILVQGRIGTNTASGFGSVSIRYGTGSAPANGAAATGTPVGNNAFGLNGAAANQISNFCLVAVATGLTKGTTYWFDLGQATSTGTTNVYNVSIAVIEL